MPLTSRRDGYHLTRYWGDVEGSRGWVAHGWEEKLEMEGRVH